MINLFWWLKPNFGKYRVSGQTISLIKKEWQTINEAFTSNEMIQIKQALVSADKCLDSALRDITVGENMGERLKSAKDRFDPVAYNKIWEAHKLRNSLVHEAGFEVSTQVIKDHIWSLRKGLESLGVKING